MSENKIIDLKYVPTPRQAEAHGSFSRYLLYGGAVGGGKIVADNSVVLTPFDFKKGQDLCVGDLINNPDGSIQRIIQIKPRVTLPLWKVYFTDKTFTNVAEEHLWLAWKAEKGRKIKNERIFGEKSAEVVETRELKEWIDRGYNVNIPVNNEQPFNMTSKHEEINPYLLGLLLGDGCLTETNITITCAEEDKKERKQTKWKIIF